MIQDYVFTFGGVVFTVALIPALRDPQKPPVRTSATTAVLLAMFAVTYASLDLWLSAATACVTCALWGVLALQRRSADA